MSKVLGTGAYGDPENPALMRDEFEAAPTTETEPPAAPVEEVDPEADEAPDA